MPQKSQQPTVAKRPSKACQKNNEREDICSYTPSSDATVLDVESLVEIVFCSETTAGFNKLPGISLIAGGGSPGFARRPGLPPPAIKDAERCRANRACWQVPTRIRYSASDWPGCRNRSGGRGRVGGGGVGSDVYALRHYTRLVPAMLQLRWARLAWQFSNRGRSDRCDTPPQSQIVVHISTPWSN